MEQSIFYSYSVILFGIAIILSTCVLLGRAVSTYLFRESTLFKDLSHFFLLGYLALSILLFGAVFYLKTPIQLAFLSVLGLTIALNFKGHFTAPSRRELLFLGFLSLITLIISRDSFFSPIVLLPDNSHALIKIHDDAFSTASFISMTAKAHNGSPLTNIFISNSPPMRATHAVTMIPALINWLGLSSFRCVSSFVIPIGILLLGIAAHLLLQTFRCKHAETGALLVLCLPSAWHQFGSNRYFDLIRNTQIISGISPAIGIFSVAICLLAISIQKKRIDYLIYSFVGALCVGLFRGQFLVTQSIPFFITAALIWPRLRLQNRVIFVSVIIIGYLLVLTNIHHFGTYPRFIVDLKRNNLVILSFLSSFDNISLGSYLRDLFSSLSWPMQMGFKWLYLLLQCLGIFGCIAVVSSSKEDTQILRIFSYTSLICFVLFASFIAPTDDRFAPAETFHLRQVSWVYFIFIVTFVAWIYKKIPHYNKYSVVGVCLILAYWSGYKIQAGPDTWDGWNFYSRDRIEVADYLKSHSDKNAIFLDLEGDDNNLIAGLSELQTYFREESFLFRMQSPELYLRRREMVKSLKSFKSWEEIAKFAALEHIQWVITGREEGRLLKDQPAPLFKTSSLQLFKL